MTEPAFALDQAESPGILIDKAADLQTAGIAERSPYPFPGAGLDGEAEGVVHGGPVVVAVRCIDGAEHKHRRQRPQAHMR